MPTNDQAAGVLALEDGRAFYGRRFGAQVEGGGEVVFNMAMTGYQEVFTDPSYEGQIVVMTYPMIGNYGLAPEDDESSRPYLRGVVIKELSRVASNWRHQRTLGAYLAANGIPGLAGIDTRALVRHLRETGAQRGVIADASLPVATLVARARAIPAMTGCDLASGVTTKAPYAWDKPIVSLNGAPSDPRRGGLEARLYRVVVYDFGVKRNILRMAVSHGCRVTVVPAKTPASQVLDLEPDGVLLSNGPGDPEPLDYAVRNTRELLGRVPIFGICLGHQILGLACGAKTYKLKFGHHGANHPVLNVATRRVEVTSQNHGFAVDVDSVPRGRVELTHINLNDQTVEGMRVCGAPAFSVQYHPEAAPGPHDARYLFADFVRLMSEHAAT